MILSVESFRAHDSTELEVLLRFLNQIKLLSETDHLLELNKCLPVLEQSKSCEKYRTNAQRDILGHFTTFLETIENVIQTLLWTFWNIIEALFLISSLLLV